MLNNRINEQAAGNSIQISLADIPAQQIAFGGSNRPDILNAQVPDSFHHAVPDGISHTGIVSHFNDLETLSDIVQLFSLTIPVVLGHIVRQQAAANQFQFFRRQMRVKPVNIDNSGFGDRVNAKILNIFY